MKKVTKITALIFIFLFFGVSGIAFYFFNSNIWKHTVENLVRDQLSKRSDLMLTITEISGMPVVGYLNVRGIQLSTPKGYTIAELSKVNLSYGLFHFLFNRGEIRLLAVDGVKFSYPAALDSLASHIRPAMTGGIKPHLSFDRCVLTNLSILDSRHLLNPLISSREIVGKIQIFQDSLTAEMKNADIFIHPVDENFRVNNTQLVLKTDSLFVKNGLIENKSSQFRFDGYVILDSVINAKIDYRLDNLMLSERFSNADSVFSKRDYLNMRGNLGIKDQLINITSNFYGQLIGNPLKDGFVSGHYRQGYFRLDTLICVSRRQELNASIVGSLRDGVNANVSVRNIDLSPWRTFPLRTSINGQLHLASRGGLFSPDTLISDIALRNLLIDTLSIDAVDGKLLYTDGKIAILDSVDVEVKNTYAHIRGECNLKKNTIDIRTNFMCDDAGMISEFAGINNLEGRIEGYLETVGYLNAPDVRGWMRGINLGSSNLKFQEAVARFGFMNIRQKRFGDIYIEATNGLLPFLKEDIPLASMIIRFDQDTTVVRSIRVVGKDLNIELQGKIVRFSDIFFDRINVLYAGNNLSNIDPIQISLKQDTIRLAEVRFALNQGMLTLSGESVQNKIRSAVANITNIDIKPLNAYLKGSRGVSGILNGLVSYTDTPTGPSIYDRIQIADVNISGKTFKNVRLESRLYDNKIILENIFLEDRENGYINGFGHIDCHLSGHDSTSFLEPTDLLSIQLQFDNFDFSIPGSYVLPKQNKDGRLSGIFTISNTLSRPEINYDLIIAGPVFGRLTGDSILVTGDYRDQKLNFSGLQIRDKHGLTRGSGYLPYDISFYPMTVKYQRDSLVNFDFTMHSSSLEFLSAYINNIESIEGDYDIALNITGTPNNPVRSGNITAKNGTIQLTSLENPVTGVTGSAVLDENMMEIISLDGYMLKPLSRRRVDTFKQKLRKYTLEILFPPSKSPEEPNVNITGTVDFSRFFRPKFNITMTGNELYIRTLLAEQEGILDGTFTVIGGDTMAIEGDVDVNEFIIRNEFGGKSETLLDVAPKKSRVYTTINLHTMIPGNLYLRNSQLDCELEGEIWIIKNGSEPYRYSGTLDIRKGKFFYYGWEFDVVRGSITFDPTEFNPTLDIEARVDLASSNEVNPTDETGDAEDYVTVRLSGDLQNPALEFESDKYNEGDILMFLTRTQLGTDDAFNQSRISSDAMNVFGMYFERQLEKSIGRISGLDEFELRTKGNLLSNQQPDQWSVSLGQKLAPNLYFKYERSLSLIEPTQLFGIEYRLNRNFSVSGEVEEDGSFRIKYLYKYRY